MPLARSLEVDEEVVADDFVGGSLQLPAIATKTKNLIAFTFDGRSQ